MNEEYLSYVDYLKSIKFENILENLKIKYADKKLILFGMGVLLDAILDNYDIPYYLNVIGISDSRFENEPYQPVYKGFNLYKPHALRALNVNAVLDTSVLFQNTKKFLKQNYYVKNTVKIEPIIQIPFKQKVSSFIDKRNAVLNYISTTGNVFNAIKLYYTATEEVITSKTNYIKKLREIRSSKEPVRTVFVVDDIRHTDFMGLYNLLYFDKDFKVFPLVIIPQNLLAKQAVSQEEIQKVIDFFTNYDTKVIIGWEEELLAMPCIHAFKPDLIFYQNPIFIKDDFSPYKMSENALTFTVEYDVRNANFTALGSKYFKKQISNFWKVFINNNEDKKLYVEYTGISDKSAVQVVNKNINTSVLKYLKKTLNK